MVRITGLPSTTDLTGLEVVPVVQAGQTRRATIDEVLSGKFGVLPSLQTATIAAGAAAQDAKDAIGEMQGALDHLSSISAQAVAAVADDLEQAKSDAAGLASQVHATQTDIAGVQADVAAAQADLQAATDAARLAGDDAARAIAQIAVEAARAVAAEADLAGNTLADIADARDAMEAALADANSAIAVAQGQADAARSEAQANADDLADEIERAKADTGSIRQSLVNIHDDIAGVRLNISDEVYQRQYIDGLLAGRSTTLEQQMAGEQGSYLNARIANEEATRSSQNDAMALRTGNMEVSYGAASGAINANPTFTVWPDSQPLPANWAAWNDANWITRIAAPRPGYKYALRQTVAANVEGGVAQWGGYALTISPGWYVMEAEVSLESGTWRGAGVTIQGDYGLDFSRDADTNGTISATQTGLRRFSKLVYVDHGLTDWHMMTNWGVLGQMDAKVLTWFRAVLRPASQAEIIAKQAAMDVGVATARLNSTEFAKTTATDALAYRAGQLEASRDSTNARLNGTEFAKTTATDALAYRAGQLEASRDSINARLNSTEFARTTATDALASRASSLESQLAGTQGSYLNARIANEEATRSSQNDAMALRTGNMEASYGAASGAINANPTFTVWPDSQSLPTNWAAWNDANWITRIAAPRPGYKYALRQTVAANVEGGVAQWGGYALTISPGWYVMEAEVSLDSGTWRGAGVTIQGDYGLDFSSEADTNGTISATQTGLRRFSKLVYVDHALTDWHMMTNWVVLGQMDAKVLTWFRAVLRPASQAEILAKQASTDIGVATARLNSTEFAKTTATDALAYRAGQLEASRDSINARLNSTEFAKTTATDALAYRAGQLEASRDSTNARLNGTEFAKTTATDALASRASALESQLAGTQGSYLNARIANEEATRSSQNDAMALRTGNMEVSYGAASGAINANPTFTVWPDSQPLPTNWAAWNDANWITRIAAPRPGYKYALRQTVAANVEGGVAQWGGYALAVPPGWYVMEAEVSLESGTWRGAGVTIQGDYGLDFSSEADTNGTISATQAGLRRFSKLVYVDHALTDWHMMTNWFVLGQMDAKTLTWFRAVLRPASQAEIIAKQASTDIGVATARLNSTEFAKSTATDALAYRAGQLETSRDSINARLNSTEFAKTTATDALAYRAGQLEASRDSINARLNSTEFAKTTATDALASRAFALESQLAGTQGSYLNARIANEESTRSSQNDAMALRTGNMEVSYGAASGAINANPTFTVWPDSQPLPTNWAAWNDANWITRIASPRPGYKYALRQSVAANVEGGLAQWGGYALAVPPGWYVMEAEVSLESGTWRGAGLTIQGFFGLDFASEADTNGTISATQTGLRRFSKLVYVDHGLTDWHLMTNWSNLGTMDAKVLTWFRAVLRPASQAEIIAKQASTDIGVATARLNSTEFAKTTATDALAYRAWLLETSRDSINARLNGTEFAKTTATDALAYRAWLLETSRDSTTARLNGTEFARTTTTDALASSISTLSADFGGLSATTSSQGSAISTLTGQAASLDTRVTANGASLTVQQAAINVLNGRNGAWLQVSAISGDNRAVMSIYADEQNSGIELDAAIRVRGPAIFDRSITADQIVANGITYMQQAYSAADHYGGAPTSGVVGYDDYGDPIYGATDGSYRTLVSMTVTMDRAGDIMALAVAKQSYAGDGQNWQAVVRVNGNIVFQTGGIATADSISLMGKLAVGAGNHTVDFLWWSSGPLLQIRAGAASLATLRRYV